MVDEEVKQSSAETRLSFRKAETSEQTPKTPLTVSPILCLQDSFHLGKLWNWVSLTFAFSCVPAGPVKPWISAPNVSLVSQISLHKWLKIAQDGFHYPAMRSFSVICILQLWVNKIIQHWLRVCSEVLVLWKDCFLQLFHLYYTSETKSRFRGAWTSDRTFCPLSLSGFQLLTCLTVLHLFSWHKELVSPDPASWSRRGAAPADAAKNANNKSEKSSDENGGICKSFTQKWRRLPHLQVEVF